MAFTKIVGAGIHTLSNVHSHNINSSGIITATSFVGPFDGTTGDFSGNVTVGGNFTVNGTTTTLDTQLVDVDKIEVTTAGTNVAVAVTHNGTGDLVRLYDGSTQVVTVDDVGQVGIGTAIPDEALQLGNNKKIHFGLNGIKAYHTGSVGYINNSTGILRITGASGQKIDFIDGSGTNYYARFNSGNSCELFYVGSGAKLITKSYGVQVTGSARATTGGDGYTFINDPDTGMHNPSDGNLHFKVNGTDRISMDSSGISTFHNSRLHIEGAGSGNTPLTINSDNATNNSVHPLIEAYADNSSRKARIGLVREASSAALGWGFFTNANTADPEERLRITSGGKIGIGNFTSINPARAVHLHEASGGTAIYATFTNGSTGTAASNGFTLGIDSAQAAILNNYSNTDIKILCNGSERLRITSDGKVGVGDFTSGTAVSQALHVKGSEPKIYLEHTGGYDMILTTSDGMGQNGITVNGGALSLAYDNKNIWMCRAGGYVAMGHASPSTRLDVKQNNGVAYNNRAQNVAYGAARFLNESGHTSGGTYTGFQFNLTGDSQNRICSIGMISEASNSRASSLVFATDDGGNRTEKLRIDSSGNVNIGVNGSSNPFTYLRFGASQYGAADIRPTDEASHKVGLAFYTDGTQDTTINPTEKLRITSSGKVIVGNDGTTFGNAAVQAFIQHGNTAGESGFSSVDTTSVAAGVGGEIAFHGKYNTGAQDYAYLGHIRGIKENATAGNTACALTFYTRPNATAPIERLRIDSSGHLTPRADTSYDLGANTSYRWRNIYGQTLSLTSYATVGSIVASDPGSSYYAYNNRIGNGLAVVGTTRLFGLVGVGDNAPSSSRSYGIDISNTDNTTGHGILTDQRGRSDLIIRNKSGTLYSYSQLMFTNGNDGYNSATFLRHTKGGYLQNENFIGDLILMTRVAGNGSSNHDFREKCTWPGGTTKAKQVWWSNGDGYSSNAQHMGEHKMIESEVVGNNQYTYFTLDTGSGSYSRGGIGRYTVTWTTGHASGTGYQTGDFRYWQHHQSGGTTVVQEHIIHRQGYSSGSYYSWSDAPVMKIFHNNATGNDGGIHFRCEGRRSSGYDMGLYVTIFLDLYAPKSSNGNVTPTLRARGHSQPANFSSEKDAFFVMYQRNNPNHSDNADRNTGLPTSNPGTAGVFYRDGTDVRVSTG